MRRAFLLPTSVLALAVAGSALVAAGQERATVPAGGTDLFRSIARRVNPAVVAIVTRSRREYEPELLAWLHKHFGELLPEQTPVHHEEGSGFIISTTGEILTNDHVVAGAELIEVRLLGSETAYRATLVARDPPSDSALIRLDHPPPGLPVATLGDSDALESGDWVMAIGNPFRLGHTVTVGVVSYSGRAVEIAEGMPQKMIQTDASINPGNSGGPLLDVHGEVVGINAAGMDREGGDSAGIGFAIPINTVKALLPQLRAGRVTRGRIGVQLHSSLTDEDARALGLTGTAGALVTVVERDSPAEHGGLQAGDFVVGVDGIRVAGSEDLLTRVSSAVPGTTMSMVVVRDGTKRRVTVTVQALAIGPPPSAPVRAEHLSDFGLTFADITTSTAGRLALPEGLTGALVQDVRNGSPAWKADLAADDIVRRINRHAVHAAADADRALEDVHGTGPVFLLIRREGRERLVQIRRE